MKWRQGYLLGDLAGLRSTWGPLTDLCSWQCQLDFLAEFKTSPLQIIFSYSEVEKKKEDDFFLCITQCYGDGCESFWAQREKRKKQADNHKDKRGKQYRERAGREKVGRETDGKGKGEKKEERKKVKRRMEAERKSNEKDDSHQIRGQGQPEDV